MENDRALEELKAIWKEQTSEGCAVSLAGVRAAAERIAHQVRQRTMVGAMATLVVAVSFAAMAVYAPNGMERLGAIWTVAGALGILAQLRMRRAGAIPPLGSTASLQFLRSELERQRDFHQAKWLWGRLAPFVPGPLLFLVGEARATPEDAAAIWAIAAVFVAIAAAALPLNALAARRYQRQIDRLDHMLEAMDATLR